MLIGGKNVIPHVLRDVAGAVTAFSADIAPEKPFDSQQRAECALKSCLSTQSVIAIGLSGSGKSSALDALAGDKFCAAYRPESAIVCWRYKRTAHPLPHERAERRFYPADALLNMEFRDTAGLEQAAVTEQLNAVLPLTDVILVTVSAMNGVNPVLWDYLATLDAGLYARMVLVITHAELLPYEQAQSLKEQLRSLSKEKLGIQLPLYPVTPAGDKAGEGVEALRNCVQEKLVRAPIEDGRIKELIDAAAVLLEEQRAVLDARNRLSMLDSGALSAIDREIDRIQIQLEDEMPARLKAYAAYVQENVSRLGKKSARQLGRFLTVKRTMVIHKFPTFIDEWFYEVIRGGIEQSHGNYNRDFLNICRDHWNHVRPRIKEQWNCDIGDFPAEKMQPALDVYKSRLGRALYKPLRDFGIKPCLSKLFQDHGDVMYVEIKILLILLILAGLLGSLGENTAGFACLGLTLILWLCCNVGLAWMGYKLNKDIVAAASEMHLAVKHGLRMPLYEAVISGICDYRKLYSDIRGQVANNAKHLTPLIRARYSLFYKLEAIKHHYR